MKIKVLETKGSLAKVSVIGKLEIGKEYYVEDALTGTQAQNRFFHLLVQEYYNSGMYSDIATTVDDLREKIKLRLGEGFEKIIYSDDTGKIVQVPYSDKLLIPARIRADRERLLGQLKSWTAYTKVQRKKCIDNLVKEMVTVGVNSKRFNEIMMEFGL